MRTSLVSFYSTAGNLRTTLIGLQAVVINSELPLEQLRRIYYSLDNIPVQQRFRHALEGEVVQSNLIFNESRNDGEWLFCCLDSTDDSNKLWPHLINNRYSRRLLLYKDQQASLDVWEERLHAAELSYRELVKKSPPDGCVSVPDYAIITAAYCPVQLSAWVRKDTLEANIGMAQVAIVLHAYKLHKGTYPDALKDLAKYPGWKLPDDPFSGKSFSYKRKANGFILYSWGQNLKDDGGKQHKDPAFGDLAWRCEN
jgi:hypothetical protein